jgi:protein arginine N-methyltransferase 1
VAKELAKVNGCRDRIEFIEDVSTRVTLPEQADVIVSDLSGAIPIYARHVSSIADARKRFLKPGGVLIPQRDTVWAAIVEAPEIHAKLAPTIDVELGLDMKLAWNMATNVFLNRRICETRLMTRPQQVVTLNYSELEDPNIRSQLEWKATRGGSGHGISLWFDRVLVDGVSLSTAPSEPETVYGAMFFPWSEPVQLAEGDTIRVDLRADLQEEDYIWRWNTVVSQGATVKGHFRQSNFFAETRSANQLRKQMSTHTPELTDEGEIEHMILHSMDGKNSIEQIARTLQQRFPARFPTLETGIGRVAGCSKSYSV